ncbi:FecR domain-containing protein [Aurantimonas marianensis]|uniref:FecR family protein n=1 Tax=Aurantimonas marianensis TaxID=2920428 RepID=A0A9X2HA72_9HYPH|nr:FecR family protein [Aurantimonas marianensis]MCP3056088.1 FecR family protein [Aurantimonas marianensis]
MSGNPLKRLAAATALVLVATGGAFAQSQGCTSTTLRDPPRLAIRCAGGLLIEAEAAARLEIRAPAGGGPPHAVTLDGRAALITVEPGRPFQILTPHAIASVRGTVYAVDADAGATAVFVAEGRVHVARRGGSDAVTLGPGDGVDVKPGEPLIVKRWPQERVSRLFARFAR